MESTRLPQTAQAVMPYLMLNGAAGFITFTEKVFGAVPFGDMHLQPDGSGIVHAEITISGSRIMCCDARGEWKPTPANLFIYVDNADKTYEEALAAGASSVMGLSDQSYGRSCGIADPYGNVWWITSVSSNN